MLVVIPVNQFLGGLNYNVDPGVLAWRTGAVGMLSGTLLTPILGLLMAGMSAVYFGDRWIERLVIIIAGLGAIALAAVMVVFALDWIQVRSSIAMNHRRAFASAMAMAMISLGISGCTLAILSFSLARAPRR